MSATDDVPFVASVFHPSDFSEGSESAFAHALAIALVRQAELSLLHAGSDYLGEDEWRKFPPVRRTLERWGLLEEGSARSAVFDELQVLVQKVNLQTGRPLSAILEWLDRHPTDLIVLATEGREGLPRWIRPSLAERLARRAETMTLFVPEGARGFVAAETGETSLRRILVPIDHDPAPAPALLFASRAAHALGDVMVAVDLLYVGEGHAPEPELPEAPRCRFEMLRREGDVVDAIVACAEERGADLVAMTTQGHDGILDALRGSVTEQVLRRVPCPLLAVPAA